MDRALISLGLALSPPSTSVSSDIMVLSKCLKKLYLLYMLSSSLHKSVCVYLCNNFAVLQRGNHAVMALLFN